MVEREIEEWSKGKQVTGGEEHVSIYSGDQIAIPSIVYDQYLSGTEAVKILYSKNTNEIGIKASDPDDPNSYQLGSGTKTINCKSFLVKYGLTVEETTKYPITVDSGVVWVDTDNPLSDSAE